MAEGHADRSSTTVNESGAEESTRARPRTTTLTIAALTLEQGRLLHQAEQSLGTTDEVIYLPHTNNPARCQQYAMAARMTELTPRSTPPGARAARFQPHAAALSCCTTPQGASHESR